MNAGFEFGACQIDIPRRLLLRAGRPQAVAPKVFALLCELLEHRERVLTKDELIDRVWRGADVSEAALARTVMKARKAIGDTEAEPGFIKTVHRVGYRFSGQVRTLAHSAVPAGPRQVRVALLPVDNGTGDGALDWVVHGLPTLVGQALEADQRIAIVGAAATAAALEALPPYYTTVQRAVALSGLLGTQCLVHAALRRTGGRLRLEYRSFGDFDLRGRLQAEDAPALGVGLARAVEEGLFPTMQWPVEFISTNALANEAFARAVEVGQREDWQAAARLLQTVLDIEPGSLTARLQHLRVLANLQDPAAFTLGESLLQAAREAADERSLAMVLEALARALFNTGGEENMRRADHHLDEALRLAAAHESEDWVFRVHIGQALRAHVGRDFTRALDFYERALRGCERSGNLMRRAAVLNNRGLAQACLGNLLVARELVEESLAICNRHHLHSNAVDALANLAFIDAAMGLFGRAMRHCEQAIAGLAELPPHEHSSAAWVLYLAGDLQAECRAPGLMARARARAPALTLVPRDDAVAHAVRAYDRLHDGDMPAAHVAMQAAAQAARASGHIEAAHGFAAARLWLLVRAGAHAGAAAWLDEMRGWPSWAGDEALQAAGCWAAGARHHGEGAPEAALQSLQKALELAPPGRWRARATLDAAWLLVERGDTGRAQRLLRDIGPWLEEHPAGIAMQARLHFAQGRPAAAAAAQQGGIDAGAHGPACSHWPYWLELRALYGAAAPAVPAAPRLLTLI